MVSQVGFEPTTRCLEGSRSIQLSYWDICVTHKFYDKRFAKTSHRAQILSGGRSRQCSFKYCNINKMR